MTKKETFKWIVQIIASVATAILTALGADLYVGIDKEKRAARPAFFATKRNIVFSCKSVSLDVRDRCSSGH